MSLDILALRPPARAAAPGPEDIPRVGTKLAWADRFGAWKVRWGFGRMSYRVEPGLYRVGDPGPGSEVLVACNYKLSFDYLRSRLGGIDAWILVLDTRGVNVWCAAGKGTFGTDELVRRVEAVSLGSFVSHRRLVLPQLGAVGVDGAETARRSGFSVRWGPVRAADLPAFLAAGCKATDGMRRVRFSLSDRLVLTPVELVQSARSGLPVLGGVLVASMLGLLRFERPDFFGLVGAWAAGCVAAPALLPWVPGRAFSAKGAILGALWAAVWICLNGGVSDPARAVAWGALFPALAAFLAMNFTGSSTYTSFSGVVAEMRVAVPLIVAGAAVGALGLAAGAFLGG